MILSASYALNSAVWSILGFTAGYGMSRWWKGGMHLKMVSQRLGLGGIIAVLGLLSVIYIFVQNHDLESKAHTEQRNTRCQAMFNAEFRKVSTARAQYADDDRKSLVTLMTVIASTSATPQQNEDFAKAVQAYAADPTPAHLVRVFQVLAGASKNVNGAKQSQALQQYLKEISEADKKRAEHPLPKLSEECGTK